MTRTLIAALAASALDGAARSSARGSRQGKGRTRRFARAVLLPSLVLGAALAVGGLLVLAASAAASPDSGPVRFWSVTRVEQGGGEVPVREGAQAGGRLQESVDIGRVVFNLPLHAPYWYFLPRDRAFGSLFSSANGAQYSVLAQAPPPNPYVARTPKGTVTHLDEYQAYVKRSGDATLRITLSDLLLQTIDDNNSLAAWECPPQGNCDPIRTIVRFHARAYAASAGGDFFTAGGIAYLKGHQHSWRPGAATSSDSPRPLWREQDFDVDGDADDSETGAAGVMRIKRAISVKVPLGSLPRGELFAVHVSLEAEAVDDRGGESAAQAFVQDPQHRGKGALLSAHGLEPRGRPHFKEPRARALHPARCLGARPRHAGVLAFSDPGYTANESERAPLVLVTRTGGSRGSTSATLSARAGSARAGDDFNPVTTTVRFAPGDSSPRLVEIPLREDAAAEPAETFTVKLKHARCGALAASHSATVTIVDDETQVPPPPQLGLTIGGTVDGLRGSGLVLTDRGTDLLVAADGRFTLPGTHQAGESYDLTVKTQPHGPDQVCTVQHGTGTVSGANVTDIVVHCETPSVPSGLDATFGSGGRASTPVGGNGHGEALVIQPGGIVTAGWRTTGSGNDFALTRHDAAGQLDHSFAVDGIATTDLGGGDDEAYDAALLPDGGVVAVGRTDAAGFINLDFGVVRYGADGTPDAGFGGGGIVKTDLLGGGDQANAVTVQPDGKIVAAGFATRNGIDGDFALVRYNADGTLDTTFGGDGIVTTDLGTRSDDALAVVVQPDGRLVVAGVAGEDVALARHRPDRRRGLHAGPQHRSRLPAGALSRGRHPRHHLRRRRLRQDRPRGRRRLRREPDGAAGRPDRPRRPRHQPDDPGHGARPVPGRWHR